MHTEDPASDEKEKLSWIEFLQKKKRQSIQEEALPDLQMKEYFRLEMWKKTFETEMSKLDQLDPNSIKTFPFSERNESGWPVKVYECLEGTKARCMDYKTIFIHPEATVYEALLLALKKWKCFDAILLKKLNELNRILPTNDLILLIEKEGWQLLLTTEDDLNDYVILKGNDKVYEILKCAPPGLPPVFMFCKENSLDLKLNYALDHRFDPCYMYKLHSQYPEAIIFSQQPIDEHQWQKRFCLVASGRYLLIFRTRYHAAFVENVLHEVDFSKILQVEPSTVGIGFKDGTESRFGIKLSTRRRFLYFCLDTEVDQKRVIEQFKRLKDNIIEKKVQSVENSQEILFESEELDGGEETTTETFPKGVTEKQEKLFLGKVPKLDSTTSALTLDLTLPPVQMLMARVKSNRNLLSLELPPFEPKQPEFQYWTMVTNQHVLQLAKEYSKRNLQQVFAQFQIFENWELHLEDISTPKGTTKFSMKKFLKGLQSTSTSTSSTTLPISSSNDSLAQSSLFQIDLEEWSQKYNEGKQLGLTKYPPILKHLFSFILENGKHVPGIFRIAGSFKRMEQLRKLLESQNQQILLSGKENLECDYFSMGYNVHDLAGLVKLFLRDLPDPLLSFKYYKSFLAVDAQVPLKTKISLIQSLLLMLPSSHRFLLYDLLKFLHELTLFAQDKDEQKGNLMNSTNLAVCLGPNILRTTEEREEDSQSVVNIVKLMIEHYEEVYFVGDDLIAFLLKK